MRAGRTAAWAAARPQVPLADEAGGGLKPRVAGNHGRVPLADEAGGGLKQQAHGSPAGVPVPLADEAGGGLKLTPNGDLDRPPVFPSLTKRGVG